MNKRIMPVFDDVPVKDPTADFRKIRIQNLDKSDYLLFQKMIKFILKTRDNPLNSNDYFSYDEMWAILDNLNMKILNNIASVEQIIPPSAIKRRNSKKIPQSDFWKRSEEFYKKGIEETLAKQKLDLAKIEEDKSKT